MGQRKKVTVTFFPARTRLDQTAQIRAEYTKFPWMKSRDCWCLEWVWLDLSWVRIPGFQCAWFRRYGSLKFSRGRRLLRFMKKVTFSNFVRGRRQLIFITNYLLIHDKQIRLNAKNEPMWNGELEIWVTMWWADENHVSDTTTGRCQEHNRDRMATFETHLKILYSCEMTTKCNISWDCTHCSKIN